MSTLELQNSEASVMTRVQLALPLLAGLLLAAGAASAQPLTENFDVAPPASWTVLARSEPLGTTSVFQGNDAVFVAFNGAPTSYAGMNFNSTGSTGTISTWLVTPPRVGIQNGDTWSFYTRTVDPPAFADRLELRLSTNGACTVPTGAGSSTAVGDFTTLLTTINPTLTVTGYPSAWTQFSGTLSGITGVVNGCLAFRYTVPNGGANGANSDYIGIDAFVYQTVPVELQTFTIE
jgi:hypothetical protein